MILIPFFFLIFFNYIKCDIPVHCLSRHVEGIWEIKLGLLKTKNSENKKLGISKNNTFEHNLDSYSYDYECGYRRPDNSEFHGMVLTQKKSKKISKKKKKKLFVFNNDRTVNIIENGYINQEYKGFWRLIYDEALYIEIYKGSKQKEVYFSFFKFKEKGYVSYSYCNSLIIGAVNVYYLNDNCTNNVCNNTPSTSNKIRENKNTKFTEYDHIERNIYKNKKYLNHEQNDLYYVLKKNINYLERKHKLNNYKILHNIYKGSLSKKENKEINTKNYFYELIDFYNDNFINLNFLTVDRYCWYGKKLNATSENPTNKIPTNIVSPLLVDVNIHNKNYETIKAQRNKSIKNNQEKNEKIYKEKIEGINISSLNLYNKSNSKKYKKNRLFDSYSYKNITLSNFDWTNKSDVKKRLGNYVKIVDNAIDQKDCGSCYANSAALIINSRVRIKYNYIKNIDFLFFSNEQMLICDFFNQGCSGGYIYISLKYAYENFLYTDECFKKYKNRYINKDKKNNYLCDRFDTFKIFLHKRKNYIQNIEGKRKEENMNAFRINLIEKKKREIWRNGENSLIKDIKVHTNNNKNEMKNHIEKSGKAYKVEIRNKEMNEKKEENSYEIDYDEINDENKDKDNDNANRNDKSSSDESSNDESSSDESSNDESSSDDSNDESSNDESNDNEIDDDGINDDELYENYILMNKKKYETNKLDMMSLNRCDIKIKVRKYEYLEIENEEDIKKYLYYNGPIAAAIEPSKQFAKYEKGILREDFIKMHDGKKSNAYIWHKVDHAVVIVGWGEETLENFMKKNNLNESDIDNIIDIKEKEKNKIIKYWKILNSWGTKWGNNGYFYILRGQNYYNIKSYLLMCDVNLFLKK